MTEPENQSVGKVPYRRNPHRSLIRRWAWPRYVLLILVTYVVILFMFNLLQRSLIYFPIREAQIEPEDADMPRGQMHTIAVRTDDQLELLGWHVLADGQSADSRDGESRGHTHFHSGKY